MSQTGSTLMKVDFLNLKRQYETIKPEIDEAISKVIEKTAFSGGPFVEGFETRFAQIHQAKYCVAVNSGTAALHLAMMALEIGPGDEVIVPTNTFFASAEAVSLAHATPVFVDCEPDFYNIDPAVIEAAITPKTKAIVAVHLYGQPAQLDQIKALADQHGLLLIEDCAQAHLAQYNGQSVGTYGVVGCFSFYPGKNLGAYGEGGAVITNDEALYRKMQALRNHGSHQKYYHEYIGHNYRMEGFQGAILDVKLNYIAQWTEARQERARRYCQKLADLPSVKVPKEMPGATHSYHLFVVEVENREALIDYLSQHGISTGIHYPVPCHLQNAYKHLNYKAGQFPVAEAVALKILSLPMFPELTDAEIDYVCETIRSFYANPGAQRQTANIYNSGSGSKPLSNTPMVSICVPNYNYGKYLKRCLDSIAAEDYPNKEIVIVDDGSTDDSLDVIQGWIEQHPQVKVIFERHYQNQGVTRTFNHLLSLSQGEYIVWLASDDYLLNNSISRRVAFLNQHPGKLAVFGDCVVVDSENQVLHQSGLCGLYKAQKNRLKKDSSLQQEVIGNWGIPGPVLMVKREIYGRIGTYDEMLSVEDWDLYLRMVSQNLLIFMDEIVSAYCIQGNNTCMSADNKIDILWAFVLTAKRNLHRFRGHAQVILVRRMVRYFVNYFLKCQKKQLQSILKTFNYSHKDVLYENLSL